MNGNRKPTHRQHGTEALTACDKSCMCMSEAESQRIASRQIKRIVNVTNTPKPAFASRVRSSCRKPAHRRHGYVNDNCLTMLTLKPAHR